MSFSLVIGIARISFTKRSCENLEIAVTSFPRHGDSEKGTENSYYLSFYHNILMNLYSMERDGWTNGTSSPKKRVIVLERLSS